MQKKISSPTSILISILENSISKMENGFLETLPSTMKVAVKETTMSLLKTVNSDEFKEAEKMYEEVIILNAKLEALKEVFDLTELDSEFNLKAYKMMEQIIDKKNKL